MKLYNFDTTLLESFEKFKFQPRIKWLRTIVQRNWRIFSLFSLMIKWNTPNPNKKKKKKRKKKQNKTKQVEKTKRKGYNKMKLKEKKSRSKIVWKLLNCIYQPLRTGRIWHKVSFFKRSLTGLNSEFSFSKTSCLTKAVEPSLPYYWPIAGGRIIGFIPFPRVLVWNAISLVQDLNSCRRVHFLRG